MNNEKFLKNGSNVASEQENWAADYVQCKVEASKLLDRPANDWEVIAYSMLVTSFPGKVEASELENMALLLSLYDPNPQNLLRRVRYEKFLQKLCNSEIRTATKWQKLVDSLTVVAALDWKRAVEQFIELEVPYALCDVSHEIDDDQDIEKKVIAEEVFGYLADGLDQLSEAKRFYVETFLLSDTPPSIEEVAGKRIREIVEQLEGGIAILRAHVRKNTRVPGFPLKD